MYLWHFLVVCFVLLVDHAGQKALRHTSTDETNDPKPTELGAFGAPIAQSVLYKATRYHYYHCICIRCGVFYYFSYNIIVIVSGKS